MSEPTGLVAVIVGGTSGIGLATVKRFNRAGCHVIIGDISAERGQEVVKQYATSKVKVEFVDMSVLDDETIQRLIGHAVNSHGRIDFAVNTAGVTGPTVEGHLLEDKDWNFILRTDLEGTWRFNKAIIAFWRSQEPRKVRDDSAKGPMWEPVLQRGSLVNVASSLGSEGKAYLAAYWCAATAKSDDWDLDPREAPFKLTSSKHSAAKHGVIGLSRALALENASWGIRINTISPGLTMSPLMQSPGYDFETAKTVYLADQPMRRFAHPDEIASAIWFTCSDGASFMTGSDWGPDGGHHIW